MTYVESTHCRFTLHSNEIDLIELIPRSRLITHSGTISTIHKLVFHWTIGKIVAETTSMEATASLNQEDMSVLFITR